MTTYGDSIKRCDRWLCVLFDLMHDQIRTVPNSKHQVQLIQQFDMMRHWADKMLESMKDIDVWLSAFRHDPTDGDD